MDYISKSRRSKRGKIVSLLEKGDSRIFDILYQTRIPGKILIYDNAEVREYNQTILERWVNKNFESSAGPTSKKFQVNLYDRYWGWYKFTLNLPNPTKIKEKLLKLDIFWLSKNNHDLTLYSSHISYVKVIGTDISCFLWQKKLVVFPNS